MANCYMDSLIILVFITLCSSHWMKVSGSGSGSGSGSKKCPVDHRHHSAFGQWANRMNETHRLSLISPALHHHAFRTVTEEELMAADGPLALAGSTECPDSPISSLDEPLMGRSLCPWYWKMNFDPNRLPAMLPEAHCRCRRAVVGARGIVPYECQPLTMHVRVLQLDEECNQFQERTIEVAVACVSVFQSAVRLNKVAGVQRVFSPQQAYQQIK